MMIDFCCRLSQNNNIIIIDDCAIKIPILDPRRVLTFRISSFDMAVELTRKDWYFQWLQSAHNSIVLFVSKSKASKALAKKLRPEVAKMYLASNTADAISIIEKLNSNPDIPGKI